MKEIQPSFYLVFTSRSSQLMSAEQLNLILRKSYISNKSTGVTGMLLYMEVRLLDKLEGRFIQLIEGDELTIQLLYEKICSDERHDKVFILASGKQKQPNFNYWSMSYGHQITKSKGYKVLEDKLFQSRHFIKQKGPAHFLKSFYEYNLQLQKEYLVKVAAFSSCT